MKLLPENLLAWFKKEDVAPGKPSHNPYRDWIIIFIVSAILFCAVLLGSIYIFKGIEEGTFFSSLEEVTIPVKKVDSAKFEVALELIKKRQTNFEEIKAQKPNIKDPSR